MQAALDYGRLQRLAAELPDDWNVPVPELPEHLLWVWRCFWRLHPDRPQHGGFGPVVPGRIPWRDLLAWAEVHDLTYEQFDFLDRCITAMDEAYCNWQAAKRAAQEA